MQLFCLGSIKRFIGRATGLMLPVLCISEGRRSFGSRDG